MEKQEFGKTGSGQAASVYTISNSRGMELRATDFGAAVVSLFVKDKDGNLLDVVLGYDDVLPYEQQVTYFGATVGRSCNRIAGAKVTIEGKEYTLDANDRGNNLHSGRQGLAKRLWKVKEHKDNAITFEVVSEDGSEGFPGSATVNVTYELTEDNEMAISYHAVSDQTTVFNMTNHCYFNLNGHDSGNVLNQELQILASNYTPLCDNKSIPTGEIAPVEGTPFDFRAAKPIGRDIAADHVQIGYGGGYDHNFVLDRTGDGLQKAAEAYSAESGIVLEVYTDCPGVQLYSGNGLQGQVGKKETVYPDHGAFCLETQFFPNSPNEPNFASPLTKGWDAYVSKSVYRFGIR